MSFELEHEKEIKRLNALIESSGALSDEIIKSLEARLKNITPKLNASLITIDSLNRDKNQWANERKDLINKIIKSQQEKGEVLDKLLDSIDGNKKLIALTEELTNHLKELKNNRPPEDLMEGFGP